MRLGCLVMNENGRGLMACPMRPRLQNLGCTDLVSAYFGRWAASMRRRRASEGYGVDIVLIIVGRGPTLRLKSSYFLAKRGSFACLLALAEPAQGENVTAARSGDPHSRTRYPSAKHQLRADRTSGKGQDLCRKHF